MRVVMLLVCLLFSIIGAVIGGNLGLMIGLGAVAIPGLGPIIAAGTLATVFGTTGVGVIIGILFGGLVGVVLSLIIARTRVSD